MSWLDLYQTVFPKSPPTKSWITRTFFRKKKKWSVKDRWAQAGRGPTDALAGCFSTPHLAAGVLVKTRMEGVAGAWRGAGRGPGGPVSAKLPHNLLP